MKHVSIYLECDCTAFRKHKRICGYVLEYIKKNGDAETREEFRAAEGTYHREILRTLQKRLDASGNPVPSVSTARTLLSATCSPKNYRSGQTTILLPMESRLPTRRNGVPSGKR